ncbi:hypothetical protein MSPP1_004069 [Malassezia sp. CBS 17886]|nr:hypothetical protein MSPP1_004069 [Malassezia sp. CBS 17886]
MHFRRLGRRQYSGDQQTNIAQQASSGDITGAVNTVLQMPNLGTPNYATFAQTSNGALLDGDGDSGQVPWFADGQFPFVQTADVPVNATSGGWQKLPGSFEGFVMNTDLVISKPDDVPPGGQPAVQPYYITDQFDPQNVKRVIVCFPGKPRDSWKYANLFYNALQWVYNQNLYGIQQGEVVIVAPIVLNQFDEEAGGAEPNWAVYSNANWEFGGTTKAPKLNKSATFYSAVDKIIAQFMNQTAYPNLKQVVVAGHSMGGQAAMRYALMKRRKRYDANIRFWIGNPGSYTWLLNDTRPVQNATCDSTLNNYPYGLGGNMSKIPKYVRTNITQNVSEWVENFRNRSVHYAFGLLDNGAGDTHCEASVQGANHLQRGTYFAQMLSQMPGGFPANHNVSFIAGISHQDYPMIAATESMDFIFGSNYTTRLPDLYGPKQSHHKNESTQGPPPPTLPAQWESAVYRTIAWVLLAVSAGGMVIVFFIFYRLFTANSNDWDRDYWEADSKHRLL